MICAAEDVGLADPQALNVAVSASLAVERLGLPEARIVLSEAAMYCGLRAEEQFGDPGDRRGVPVCGGSKDDGPCTSAGCSL